MQKSREAEMAAERQDIELSNDTHTIHQNFLHSVRALERHEPKILHTTQQLNHY